jgi:hypothetical protein
MPEQVVDRSAVTAMANCVMFPQSLMWDLTDETPGQVLEKISLTAATTVDCGISLAGNWPARMEAVYR